MTKELTPRTNNGIENTPKATTKHTIKGIEHPTSYDVLFGSSHYSVTHIGNLLWEQLVIINTCLYINVSRRLKTALAESIVKAVTNQENPGRFLQKDEQTNFWYDVGHKKAIENTHVALIEGCVKNRQHASNRRPLIIRDILEKLVKISVNECQKETVHHNDSSRSLEGDGTEGNLAETVMKEILSIPPLRSITSEKPTTEVSPSSKSLDKKNIEQIVDDSNDESRMKRFEEPKISKKNKRQCIEADGTEGNLTEMVIKNIPSIPPLKSITSEKPTKEVSPSSKLLDKKNKEQIVDDSNDESRMKGFEEPKISKKNKRQCIEADGTEGNSVVATTKNIPSLPSSQSITSEKPTTEVLPSSKLLDKKNKEQIVDDSNDESWMKQFEELKTFKNIEGHCNVPQDCSSLAEWVTYQRIHHKLMLEGKPSSMTDERLQHLESLSFMWDVISPEVAPSSNEKELVSKKKNKIYRVLI